MHVRIFSRNFILDGRINGGIHFLLMDKKDPDRPEAGMPADLGLQCRIYFGLISNALLILN